MATLFQRLTSSGSIPYDEGIILHGFEACLYEYARGALTQDEIADRYIHDTAENQWIQLFGLIDDESTQVQKLLKVQEITDVLIIHNNRQTNGIYPTASAVATRLLG